jgi:hypothetical protein
VHKYLFAKNFSVNNLYDANKDAFKKLHGLLHAPLDKLAMSNIKLNAHDDLKN